MKILSAYDGTLHAKRALVYGIARARESGGVVTLLQVFDPSLFIDYDAGPQAETAARKESTKYLEEAKQIIKEEALGVDVRVISEEGDAPDLIVRHAAELQADLILCPPGYKSVFGAAPCPVVVVPGTVLVPVDSSEASLANIDRIAREASATASSVVLLGIVPVHLYSPAEKVELEAVKKATVKGTERLKKKLSEKGIKTKELLRDGYPDEEILKAADEFSVSRIILPSGGTTPSELAKAAAILLDGPQKLKWHVLLLPAEEAAAY